MNNRNSLFGNNFNLYPTYNQPTPGNTIHQQNLNLMEYNSITREHQFIAQSQGNGFVPYDVERRHNQNYPGNNGFNK